ncbi:flagellar hook-length control protein FliK [Virgibacillus sp. MSP4-1]|uniref:flagellar hook-length control protein FliK n=1 Tax=Virgibacillus sp. MSP4-1 TaxID=2700081 RepID=UPI00039DD78D|nr:flagellar hook-length control protein FliK [Virgibacillus sp. MSP4-1]QHS22250.1 flagellar hook-length control protein FliK [Virgibacillus sp. MSP4-1]
MNVALLQSMLSQTTASQEGKIIADKSKDGGDSSKNFLALLSSLQPTEKGKAGADSAQSVLLGDLTSQLRDVLQSLEEKVNEGSLSQLTAILAEIANAFSQNETLRSAGGKTSRHSEGPLALFDSSSFSIAKLLENMNENMEIKQQLLTLAGDFVKMTEQLISADKSQRLSMSRELQTAFVKLSNFLSQAGHTLKQNGQSTQANVLFQQKMADGNLTGKHGNGNLTAQVNQSQSNASLTRRMNPAQNSSQTMQAKSAHEWSAIKTGTAVSVDSMPMSKVEQFTIYLQRNGGNQAATNNSHDFMEQFQKIIKSSRFIQNEGSAQMTLKLKPAHLGDMIVKFTQINGEMAVRIAVSSQAAKEMLESNINQLRHMFQPHQVVIDKQAEPILTQPSSSYLNFSQNEEEQEQRGDAYRDQLEDEETTEEDYEDKSFEDFLNQTKAGDHFDAD